MKPRRGGRINQVLRAAIPGTVLTQSWLSKHNVDRWLAKQYVKSGWLERIAPGAYRRAGDSVGWPGAVFGLQNLDRELVHVGGETALALHGLAHFLEAGPPRVQLFGGPRTRLPKWMSDNQWNGVFEYTTSVLFDEPAQKIALTETLVEQIPITMSTSERALLEVLHDVPEPITVGQASTYFRAATTVRPRVIQELLEACRSVKVKRLLFLIADHSGLRWVNRLDRDRVDLGAGKRVLGGGGHYYAQYELSLPEALDTAGDTA